MSDTVILGLFVLLGGIVAAVPATLVAFATLRAARVQSTKTDMLTGRTEAVMEKVDGNYSDLKAEVVAAKAEVVVANQRIAVLIERLITSTPATAPVVAVVNEATPHPRDPESKTRGDDHSS